MWKYHGLMFFFVRGYIWTSWTIGESGSLCLPPFFNSCIAGMDKNFMENDWTSHSEWNLIRDQLGDIFANEAGVMTRIWMPLRSVAICLYYLLHTRYYEGFPTIYWSSQKYYPSNTSLNLPSGSIQSSNTARTNAHWIWWFKYQKELFCRTA